MRFKRLLTVLCILCGIISQGIADVIRVPAQYASINDAVYVAQPFDTVYIANGVYDQFIYTAKPLTILGEDVDSTIIFNTYITGTGMTGVHNTLADINAWIHLENITFHRDLNILASYFLPASIKLRNASHSVIRNVVCRENVSRGNGNDYYGADNIMIWDSDSVTIVNVRLTAGEGHSYYCYTDGSSCGTPGGTCLVLNNSKMVNVDSCSIVPGYGGEGSGQAGSSGRRGYAAWLRDVSSLSITNSTYESGFSYGALSQISLDGVNLNTSLTGAGDPPQQPKEYHLSQNFPNPFNPNTILEFSIPEEVLVDIALYDLIGRRVMGLLQAVTPPGTHYLTVRGDRLSTGVYICRMAAGNFTGYIRMVISR